MTCLIEKIEFVGGKVVYTAIGYSNNDTHCDTLNSNYDAGLGAWIETNKTDLENGSTLISEYFDVTPTTHIARTTTTYLGGLTEITDISGL